MLLAIDAGNTNIVFAVFDGGKLQGQWRKATHPLCTADEYAVWLVQLLHLNHLNPEAIDAAVLASVVPAAQFDLQQLCARYFRTQLRSIGDADLKLPIAAKVDHPGEVGADRIVNALAAAKRYAAPLVVVDFGTATTFDVVDGQGNYIGGVIAPGIQLSLSALTSAAARLPNVAVEAPASVIGKNTVSAVQSGIYYGYLGLIEGILARIRNELGGKVSVIATGGLAPLYAKAGGGKSWADAVEADLTLLGLADVYTHLQAKKMS